MNKATIVKYNQEQLEHMRLVRELVTQFAIDLIKSVNTHDESKFHNNEYWSFIKTNKTLNKAHTGNEPAYQKNYHNKAIQHHVHNNPHHPEFWDKDAMPVEEAIIMYFDWKARAKQRGTKMEDFWEYNTAKLEDQQYALDLVEYFLKMEE